MPLVTTAIQSPRIVAAVAADCPGAIARMIQSASSESFFVAGSQKARCTIVSIAT